MDLQALANNEDGVDVERCRRHRKVIDLIGDRVLHDKLLALYNRRFPTEDALSAMQSIRSLGGDIPLGDREKLIASLESTLQMLRGCEEEQE